MEWWHWLLISLSFFLGFGIGIFLEPWVDEEVMKLRHARMEKENNSYYYTTDVYNSNYPLDKLMKEMYFKSNTFQSNQEQYLKDIEKKLAMLEQKAREKEEKSTPIPEGLI